MIPAAEVARLAAGLPARALLVLDGAYAEFVPGFDGHAGLVEARDNVVMTRTFSKIHGLGGLRVGWGYGPAHVIDALNRVRGPFNLSTGAARRRRGGGARHRYTAHCRAENTPQPRRRWPRRWRRSGVPSDPSEANFVLARFRDRAEAEACDRALRDARDHRAPGRGLQAAGRRCASPSATPRPAPGSPRRSAPSCGCGRDAATATSR